MAAPPHPGQAKAIEMFAAHMPTGAIVDATGADARSVKRWRAAWKKDAAEKPEGRAPTPARAPARSERPTSGIPDPEHDPVGHWRAKLDEAQSSVDEALSHSPPHTQAAATWAKIADTRSAELKSALERDRQRRERDDRAKIRDPVVLAVSLLARLVRLLSVLGPEHRAKVADAHKALGLWLGNTEPP